jgi:hypothetical protein
VKKNKKVNQLKLIECEEILKRLQNQNQKDSLYYIHVLNRYRSLIPSFKDSVTLSKITSLSGALFSSSFLIE